MKITRKQIKIKDIFKDFEDKEEEGVYGFGGLLNIRPAYQREFVYERPKEKAVIDTIRRNLPLGVIYWGANEDGTFDVIDGQQRILSICHFMRTGGFSLKGDITYHNFLPEEQKQFDNYELDVFICEGSDIERLEWFRTINIASEPLNNQELLNANYVGSWLSDAKKKFSKKGCPAYDISNKYVKGSPIRQELLELALKWICLDKKIKDIADYMKEYQNHSNADELWDYYKEVIDWIKATFKVCRSKEMKGVDWGRLYVEFGNNNYDTDELEKKISALMREEFITSKSGVYEYVLSGCEEKRERVLSVRAFSDKDKRTKYEQQNGICPICGNHFEIEEMQGDHRLEWSNGGKTVVNNLQMVCCECHKALTARMVKKNN